VAMILLTVNIGQLTAQVNAADCMLDFINNHAMLASIYISLAIEASGLLHSVYLVQIAFAKLSGTPVNSNEPPRAGVKLALFWGRVVMSLGILGFALAVQLDALFKGWTNMWAAVPAGAAIPIVFLLLGFVGIMEGMQIAAFAVVKQDESEYRDTHKIAHANCQLLFKGKNLGRFLIGRQLLVCASMFVAARVFSINKGHPEVSRASERRSAHQRPPFLAQHPHPFARALADLRRLHLLRGVLRLPGLHQHGPARRRHHDHHRLPHLAHHRRRLAARVHEQPRDLLRDPRVPLPRVHRPLRRVVGARLRAQAPPRLRLPARRREA
jgi:hypothetical protein